MQDMFELSSACSRGREKAVEGMFSHKDISSSSSSHSRVAGDRLYIHSQLDESTYQGESVRILKSGVEEVCRVISDRSAANAGQVYFDFSQKVKVIPHLRKDVGCWFCFNTREDTYETQSLGYYWHFTGISNFSTLENVDI